MQRKKTNPVRVLGRTAPATPPRKARPRRSEAVELAARRDWLRSRRELLAQVRAQVRARLGPEPKDLRRYREAHDRELARPFRASDKHELLLALARTEVFYGGDFHAFGQAQRAHLRILRGLDFARPVTLALEAFPIQMQPVLDDLTAGKVSLEEIPTKVSWREIWGFPWENYRPLLEFALKKKLRLVALNSPAASLKTRDRHAAEVIGRELQQTPEALVYVIFGDLHLARVHLPKAVEKVLARPVASTILYINSARIYFQLARQGLEHSVDLVRLRRDCFCLLCAPPWVQWQSYLLFLDQSGDLDLDPADFDDEESEFEDELEFDPTDQVMSVARVVARDLKLPISDLNFGDISIYGSDDERLWRYLNDHLTKREKTLVRTLISNDRSFLIPSGGIGYLAQPTVNHAAFLAGQYLHSKLSPRHRPIWNFPEDMRALIWQEAVGFFASKLINHKRVSETLKEIQTKFLDAGESQKEVLKLVLDHRMSELVWLQEGRRRPVKFRPRRRASYLEAARILGGMLGERLYLGFRSRKLKLSELLDLLRLDVESELPAKVKTTTRSRTRAASRAEFPIATPASFTREGYEKILRLLQQRLGVNALEKRKSKKESL